MQGNIAIWAIEYRAYNFPPACRSMDAFRCCCHIDGDGMASQHYSRAPILEAVLDLKYEGALSDRDTERLRDAFKRNYPTIEEKREFRFEIKDGKGAVESHLAGYKLTAKNGVDLVLINSDSIGTVRLAPYDSWEHFRPLAESNFEVFTKVLGRKKITRIGVRFINRIDIPNAAIEGQPLHTFFTVGISLSLDVSDELNEFSLSVTGRSALTGAKILIQSGTLAPALLDHTSVSLDIDASWDGEIPGRIDEMWAKADILRETKNDVFEKCITDHVRKLIL
jgi:uncharacterized protein (TIGR04255 family)